MLDEVLDARAQRDLIRAEVLEQLRDWPILLSAVSAKPAFPHGEGSYQPGAPECYRDTMRHCQWLNLVGLPGASVPVGSSAEGLPIGVQVIGQPFEEELVLTVAEQIEQDRGPWQPPPI
jgi:Asp-tRNA(Asn)/Glu-tRNA(Gln) amidotransferase A subunit family amidase